jgi:hypothetical protein
VPLFVAGFEVYRVEPAIRVSCPGGLPILEVVLEPIVLSAAGAVDLEPIVLGEDPAGGGEVHPALDHQAGTKTGRR